MGDYDSRPETLAHIDRVRELLIEVMHAISDRGLEHDQSKLVDPELGTFNEYTPKLKASTYGTEEYQGFLKGMGAGLRHHYEQNRHHPEHFTNGIHGMTHIDLIEMLADWKAATERHADGDMARSLGIQKDRFQIGNQLHDVLWNTALAMGWTSLRIDGLAAGQDLGDSGVADARRFGDGAES